MSRLKKILLAAVVAHFALAILGASDVSVEKYSRPLGVYSALTGANAGYGFFAPGVGGQLRATFLVDGRTATLENGDNREADLKIQNIVTQFWERVKEEKLRRAMTASWAGKMFARFPTAKSVVVKVEAYDPPDMKDWRAGVRHDWEPFYTAKYVRNQP